MTKEIDYGEWKSAHASMLNNFTNKEIFFLFSAGKDSSLAMYLMLKAGEEFGFSFQSHVGAYPVHRYDREENERISSYWEARGIRPVWHTPKESDEILETEEKPCLKCQSVRKKMLRGFMSENVKAWDNVVIITSYSLWDLVSYVIEMTLTRFLGEVNEDQQKANEVRRMETMQRFQTLLKMKEGYTVFRPLVRYNGIDIEHTVGKIGIPTLKTPCRFGDQRPKRLLEKYYKNVGNGFDYDQLFEYTQKSHLFPNDSTWSDMGRDEYLGKYF